MYLNHYYQDFPGRVCLLVGCTSTIEGFSTSVRCTSLSSVRSSKKHPNGILDWAIADPNLRIEFSCYKGVVAQSLLCRVQFFRVMLQCFRMMRRDNRTGKLCIFQVFFSTAGYCFVLDKPVGQTSGQILRRDHNS